MIETETKQEKRTMKTKIYSSYAEFINRSYLSENGVSQKFADQHPNYAADNKSNSGCYDCSDCTDCTRCAHCSDCSDCSDCTRCADCTRCSRCSDCSDCSGSQTNKIVDVPIIDNIHAAVFAAASAPKALNMESWHTCDTTHCRAGWVVHLAGDVGRKLESQTSTLFAAMRIYRASSSVKVSPVRFFETNEKALADMKRCATEEAGL